MIVIEGARLIADYTVFTTQNVAECFQASQDICSGRFFVLRAILDLYERRIVSYVIRDHNNNALVFDTFDNGGILGNFKERTLLRKTVHR